MLKENTFNINITLINPRNVGKRKYKRSNLGAGRCAEAVFSFCLLKQLRQHRRFSLSLNVTLEREG